MLAAVRKVRTAGALASFLIRARTVGYLSTDEIVDLAYRHSSFAPVQIRAELLRLAQMTRELKPQRMLEIGTNTGGTFFVLCQNCQENATVISLDLPGARFGNASKFYREPVIRNMKRPGQKLHRIRMDSHLDGALAAVADVLGGEKLDFLFIDGDHTYLGVKRDFEMYSPLVRPRGVIGFHDIVLHPPESGCEVSRFWNEIKGSYQSKEFVADHCQNWAGIGVVSV